MLSPVPTISVVTALFTFVCTVIGYTIKRVMSIERIKICWEMKNRPLEETPICNQAADIPVDEMREIVESTVQIIELTKYDPTLLQETLLET